MSENRDDQIMKYIALLGSLRQIGAGGSESQIHTQEGVTIRTRFVLPLLQMLAVAGAFCVAVAGVFLFSSGVSWLLDLEWDAGSYLLAWALALLALGAVSAAVQKLLKSSMKAVQTFAYLVVLLVLGLAVGSFLLTVRARFDFWRMAGMTGGAALILAALAWGYNQFMDTVYPYWRQSPFEQEIAKQVLPMFRNLFASGEATKAATEVDPRWNMRNVNRGTTRRPVPVPAREGNWSEMAHVEGEEELYEADEEQWEREFGGGAEESVTIDPKAGNLIWFVHWAASCQSLSIRDLTQRPAPMLPFEEDGTMLYLRRAMIRRLLARGSTENEVRVDGHEERGLGTGGWWELRGKGATAEWVADPEVAKSEARQMWREVMGDEVPVPDPGRSWEYLGNAEAA